MLGLHTWAHARLVEGKALGWLEARVLQSHLQGCVSCRSLALDLVEFKAGEGAQESYGQHKQLMQAFEKLRRQEREGRLEPLSQPTPLIRPSFVASLAMAALLVIAVTLLTLPSKTPQGDRGQAAPHASAIQEPRAATPRPTETSTEEASPTPSATPSPTVAPSLSPTASVK